MPVQSFKDLVVWQRAMEVVEETYALTRQLPKSETYGLVAQMNRSAVSIPSNIAEGKKRGTGKDFIQFLRVAAGSAAELETQLLVAERVHSISSQRLKDKLGEVQKMLSTIISKLTKRATTSTTSKTSTH